MNNIEKLSSCPTCEHQDLTGTFCPHCGQKLSIQRFTLKRSFSAVLSKVFNLEKGFTYTLKELILRPEWIRDKYLHQGTVRYFHPFRLVFVLAGLYALLYILSGAFEIANLEQTYVEADSDRTTQMQRTFNNYLKNHLAFIIMLIIPFYALVSRWFYKKFQLYYGEHLIITSYSIGLALALSLPAIALFFLPYGQTIFNVLSYIIFFGAITWVYHRCFRQSIFLSFVKVLTIYILTFILLLLITALIIIIIGFSTKFVS